MVDVLLDTPNVLQICFKAWKDVLCIEEHHSFCMLYVMIQALLYTLTFTSLSVREHSSTIPAIAEGLLLVRPRPKPEGRLVSDESCCSAALLELLPGYANLLPV